MGRLRAFQGFLTTRTIKVPILGFTLSLFTVAVICLASIIFIIHIILALYLPFSYGDEEMYTRSGVVMGDYWRKHWKLPSREYLVEKKVLNPYKKYYSQFYQYWCAFLYAVFPTKKIFPIINVLFHWLTLIPAYFIWKRNFSQ